MDLQFERGRAEAPRGHALLSFTSAGDGGCYATYLVVLPIALQLSKYLPPMFAAQLPLAEVQSLGAVPLPPIPESVESRDWLTRLADLRQDDLLDGGGFNPSDLSQAMSRVSEVAQQYARAFDDYLRNAPAGSRAEDAVSDSTVSDVIYGLMSEQQKLAELAKLAGQLRYAVEGGDRRQVDEAIAEIQNLARRVPASYELSAFLEAARQPGPVGERLSSLYLDRCYKLASEDYAAIHSIDEEIRRLRGSGGS